MYYVKPVITLKTVDKVQKQIPNVSQFDPIPTLGSIPNKPVLVNPMQFTY